MVVIIISETRLVSVISETDETLIVSTLLIGAVMVLEVLIGFHGLTVCATQHYRPIVTHPTEVLVHVMVNCDGRTAWDRGVVSRLGRVQVKTSVGATVLVEGMGLIAD